MGKVHTTTETMDHIATIVDEIAKDIKLESDKLLKTINSIQEKTSRAIKQSDRTISELEGQVSKLESQISVYESMEDEDHSYQSQIAACQAETKSIKTRIRKERMRNNELRQAFSQFRQQSIETLKVVKKTNLATEDANIGGKQYLAKKTSIISSGYGKIVSGATALSSGLGSMFHGNSSTNNAGENDGEAQEAFSIKNFENCITKAQIWGRQAFRDWNDTLNIVERQSLIDYKKELYPHEDSYYVNINNTLRGKDNFKNGNQVRYARIHSALSRSSVPADVIAYRAITREAFENMIVDSQLAGGDGLRDNGFMSCSLVSDNYFLNNPNNDVVMRLTIPEGTRGGYIGNVGTELENECEILLDCGSNIFITNTSDVPRSTLTGNQADRDIITLVEGVVES